MTSAGFDGVSPWQSARVAVRNVGAAVTRWNDPRRKLLRQRRTALHTTLGLGSITGAFTAGTAGLAVLDAPSLLVAGGCGVAVLVGTPAAAAAARLRRLHKVPLPPERAPVPSPASPGYAPLIRLAAAELSLRELIGVLSADVAVPAWVVQEAGATAHAAAVRLRQEAADLGAVERARAASPVAARELAPVVQRAVHQLGLGVAEYERVVASAAHAVATTSNRYSRGGDSLRDAAERIDGLTEALAELAGSTR